LWECSPVRFGSPHPEAIIDTIFPGNPLLCVGARESRISGSDPAWNEIAPLLRTG
jgi:hypothetical protein